MKRLSEDPPLKDHDFDAILKFARDLHECELTCDSRPDSNLNSQQVVGKIFARLLPFLQEKFFAFVFFQLEKGL